VISVALKTPLETRLGICIYKTSLLHRPDDYYWFHTKVSPPQFITKLHPWLQVYTSPWTTDCEIFQSESNPDPQKLNPIQSWSTKFLKIFSPIQFSSAHSKPCILFCIMRQNRHSLLAFPKLNMALSVLPTGAKALLELFCHYAKPIGQVTIGLVPSLCHTT